MRGDAGVVWFVAGVAVGAGLVYFLDSQRGRYRRALTRDQGLSLANNAQKSAGRTARDLGNRAQGVVHEARAAAGV